MHRASRSGILLLVLALLGLSLSSCRGRCCPPPQRPPCALAPCRVPNRMCSTWATDTIAIGGQQYTRPALLTSIENAANGASGPTQALLTEVLAHIALYRAQQNCVRTCGLPAQTSNLPDIAAAYGYATSATPNWLQATEKLEQGH